MESRREKIVAKDDRTESERKVKTGERKRMLIPKLPEKALKSTYIIKDEGNRLASAGS